MKPYILFLLHLPPPVHGSSMVGSYIKKSDFINNNIKSEYINLLASRNITDTGKVNFKKILDFISIWFVLFKVLFKKKPDLCYLALTTTGLAFYRDVFLIILLKLFRVKIVYHLHNKGVSSKKNNLIYYMSYKYVFRGTNVILLSERLYKDIKCFVPKTKIFICPNGIPEIEIENKNETKTSVVKLLFLSNLIESKGVFILLDSLAVLDEKGLNFECNIIGGEGDIKKKELNDYIEDKGLHKKVFYQGKKYGKEKHLYFIDSDIFVFPTYYHNETFGLVNIEAMQYSLPVVSTDEGAIPDIVENNVTGYIVEKRNTIDLSDKIEKLLLNETLRNEMGNKGKEKFVEFYKLEVFEKKLYEILKDVIYEY